MIPPAPLIGHTEQLAALELDLSTGNVGHAYLFSGPAHVGKMTTAKWFASKLLAVNADEDPAVTAEKVQKLLHPDLLVLDQLWMEDKGEDFDVIAKSSNVPQEHRKKAKAKTDTIGIDDVRAIQDRLLETGMGTYRCCIIRSMERMQAEAVNALLKILEEPPPGVVFLLTTSAQSSLLPTLISRTRVIPFARLPLSELRPLVKGMDDEEASFILRLSQGAPGIVQQLRADPESYRREQAAYVAARTFWSSQSLAERLRILAPLQNRGPEADRLLLHLSLTLRDEPELLASAADQFMSLLEGLETNVSGQLLAQRFALEITPSR